MALTEHEDMEEKQTNSSTTKSTVFRSNMLSFIRLFRQNEQRISQKAWRLMEKTPFWDFVKSFRDGNVKETDYSKRESLIVDIIMRYDSESKTFRIGDKNLKIKTRDVSSIFGLQNGKKEMELTHRGASPKDVRFRNQWFPKCQKMRMTVIKDSFEKAASVDTDVAASDFVRLLILYLSATIFFSTKDSSVGWFMLEYIRDLDHLDSFNWAETVKTKLMDSIHTNHKEESVFKVTGCVMLLPFWLAEHTKLIRPLPSLPTPCFLRWNLKQLRNELRKKPFGLLTRDEVHRKSFSHKNFISQQEPSTLIPSSTFPKVLEDSHAEDDKRVEIDTLKAKILDLERDLCKISSKQKLVDLVTKRKTSRLEDENSELKRENAELRKKLKSKEEELINRYYFSGHNGNASDNIECHVDTTVDIWAIDANTMEDKATKDKDEGGGLDEVDTRLTMYTTIEGVNLDEKKMDDDKSLQIVIATEEKVEGVNLDEKKMDEDNELKIVIAAEDKVEGVNLDEKIMDDDNELKFVIATEDKVEGVNLDEKIMNDDNELKIVIATEDKVEGGLVDENKMDDDNEENISKATEDKVDIGKLVIDVVNDVKSLEDEDSEAEVSIVEVNVRCEEPTDPSSMVNRIKTKKRKHIVLQDYETTRSSDPTFKIPSKCFPGQKKRIYNLLTSTEQEYLDAFFKKFGNGIVWGNINDKFVLLPDLIELINNNPISNMIIDAFADILQRSQDENRIPDNDFYIFSASAFYAVRDNREGLIDHFIFSRFSVSTKYRYNMFPINSSRSPDSKDGYHWTLLVLDTDGGSWTLYNPMRVRKGRQDTYLMDARKMMNKFDDYHNSIIPFPTATAKPDVVVDQECPQQLPKTLDCGPLVCYYMQELCEGRPLKDKLSRKAIKQFRATIASEILNDPGYTVDVDLD